MLAVFPDPSVTHTRVTGTGNDDGTLSDASIEVGLPGGRTFTLRTIVRLGERIGSGGWPHGTMTDAVSIAALATSSLMLQAIPPGLSRPETVRLMNEADVESNALARDRGGWSFSPMVVGDVSYALWHRAHRLGFVAHADLGDRVVAAWGAGELPPVLQHVQLHEL